MLLIFSKRVFLWFEQFQQWRKKWIVVSICQPQLQNGSRESWKLCLNLCSRKWLSPFCNLVSSLIPWGLCTLNLLLGLGLKNLRMGFLKALTNSEFQMLLSSLFHWRTVDGKKVFRMYSCLALNKGILLRFLVVCIDKTLRIISKRWDGCFFLSLKNKHSFWYHRRILSTQDLILDKTSLLRNLW